MDQLENYEFKPEEDLFSEARKKGVNKWIIAHLFKGKNKLIFAIIVLTLIIVSLLSAGVLVVIGMAINDFITGNFTTLITYSLIVLFMSITWPLLNVSNMLLREYLAQNLEKNTRKEFYANLLGKSQSFHDMQKIGDVMARATNDVRMLNFLISPAITLIIDSFTSIIITIFYILIFYPAQLAITPILYTIVFVFLLWDYDKKLGPVAGKLRLVFGEMNASLNETLAGIEVVKSSTREKFETEKYLKKAKDYRDAFVEQGYIMARYLPLLILPIAVTAGLGHSIYLNYLGIVNIGQIISYVGLIIQLSFATHISIFVFTIIRLARAGAERLLEMMNEKTEIGENAKGLIKEIKGSVKFENVSFNYPHSQKSVIKNVTFEIESGKTVAIVGTTGSGKSTLTKLISRLYDVSNGRILIDDIDIRDYALQSLRNQISYIEQDIFLFSNSIKENITFGRNRPLNEVIEVSKQAQAHEFIEKLPEGYESEVGERGVQLSGGEKQRIAIARSFLTDAPILVLDDSTSAIDSETEDKIQRAINSISKKRTTFLITHRLSQIRWADLILVLKRGEIAAKGTHEELLNTSEEYRRIFIKKFDLDDDNLSKEV